MTVLLSFALNYACGEPPVPVIAPAADNALDWQAVSIAPARHAVMIRSLGDPH
jgi:hypothetical protein